MCLLVYNSLPNLHEQDAIDDVEHVQNGAHRGGLYLYRGQRGSILPRVDFVHFLLQNHGLVREVLQALGGFLGFLVVVAELQLRTIFV